MRGPKLDLKARILARVDGAPGAVWTPVDFLDLGARAAVDKAMQRLANDGALRRIDRGLYDKPATNGLTRRPTSPSARAVVDAVARRDNARLLVDGMTAANDLGLTTAVPSQVTVLTDARLRAIQLGAQDIQFKQAAPSRLYWAGHPAMRVVQALYWMQDLLPNDGSDVLRQLRNMIVHAPDGPAIAFDLQTGLPALPTWMQTQVRTLLSEIGFPELQPRPDPVDDRHRMAPIGGPPEAAD